LSAGNWTTKSPEEGLETNKHKLTYQFSELFSFLCLSRLPLAVTWDTVTPFGEALETQTNSTPVSVYANSSPILTNPRDAEGEGNNVINSISGRKA
jgi:hypothetical protein